MKINIVILLLLLFCSSQTFAECTKEQEAAVIDVEIVQLKNRARAGGNHGFMDIFQVIAPVEVAGTKLVGMELTEGEVAEFWVPLAFKVTGTIATVEITGYREAVRRFEVAIYYEGGLCSKSVQTQLSI